MRKIQGLAICVLWVCRLNQDSLFGDTFHNIISFIHQERNTSFSPDVSFAFLGGSLYLWATKSTDMNTRNIPQELTNIPFGQIIILTNSGQGITSTTIQKIQAVISLAGSLGQKGIVYALPVDAPELWDCFICKVKTEDGIQILVSDKDSLIEMLCVFLGLDYYEVSKTVDIAKRYKGHVTLGGESHPVRIPITPARKPEKEEAEVGSTLIQCITVHTKEGELKKIEDILEECALYGIEIDPYELMGIHKKVKERERKTYELDIDIDPGKEGWNKDKTDLVFKRECDIFLVDENGKKHHLEKLNAQTIALYLTFILFKDGDGIKITDLKTNEDFYRIFIHICDRLKSINKIPDKITLWKNANRKRGEIKKAISDATNGDKIAERLFAIEGMEGQEFRVEGATDELREKIRKMFDIV